MSVGPGEDVAFGRGLWSGDDEEPDQRGGGASNDEEGHGEGGVLSPQACEGAMEPAATHWVKPWSAEPVPGWSGTSVAARAPLLGMSPWAHISTKKES